MSKDEVRSRTASVEEVEDDGFSVFSGDVQAVAAAGERLFGDLAAAGSPWSGSRFGAEAVSDDSGDESDGSRGLTGARRRLEEQVKERAAALRDMAATWQEASRMDIAVHLKRGCFPRVGADRQPVVPERVFSCGRTFNVTSLEEGGGVYEAIRRGKVMANVIGATGIGKSTAFGAKIGVKCGARVLQVAPDTVLAAEHGKALSSILAPSRMWPTEKGAALVLMTPEQFCGRFFGDGWDIMLSCFDVVMVDEAHIPAKYQYGIRAAFSSKDVGNTSLLLLTATAADQADMQSTRDTPEYTPRLLEDIVKDDGFLDGSFCVDRSVFLVESDERLRRVMGPLIAQGVEVIALESNASAAMVDEARRRLQADSATVRILLAHNRFGTGYNLPLERVVTTGLTRVLRERDGEFSWGAVPLTAPEVKQHLARAGRGICQNARKGVVLLPQKDLAPPQKLSKHEEFDTFVLLTAMGIEPCARLRKVVSAEVPMGLSRRVAVGLLQYPTLPPRLLVRFLAADGRFPPAYYKALKGFSTVSDSATLISAFDEPTHYAEWPAVSTFSVIDKDDGSLTRVPVKCTGELAAQLVFVCAAAQGQYKPEPVPQYFDDGYESGPETRKASATVVYKIGHRNPLLVAPAPVEEVGSSRGFEYSYDVPLDDQAAYGRRAGLVVPQLVTEHLRGDGFELGVPTVEHFTDAKGIARVRLVFADGSPVLVHSPGGSTVMSFPAKLWRELIAGDPLDLQSFKAFVKYVGTFVESFCESSAFSHWSPVWLTVLRSLTRVDVIRYVKEKNLAPYVMTMCTKLWERYVRGMHLAVSVSHTSRKWWRRLVNGYDESRVRKKGAAVGEAPIVQTQDFKERLYAIREAFAVALSAMETGGFYSPGAVSSLQNVLPVSRRLGNRVFDAVRDGSAYPRLTRSTSPEWLDERDHLLNRFG